MAKLQWFDYIALYHHKTTKDNAGNDVTPDSEIAVENGHMLAPTMDAVSKKVARMIPEKYENELHLCEIIVRPF